jgi:hypothetical protein
MWGGDLPVEREDLIRVSVDGEGVSCDCGQEATLADLGARDIRDRAEGDRCLSKVTSM